IGSRYSAKRPPQMLISPVDSLELLPAAYLDFVQSANHDVDCSRAFRREEISKSKGTLEHWFWRLFFGDVPIDKFCNLLFDFRCLAEFVVVINAHPKFPFTALRLES